MTSRLNITAPATMTVLGGSVTLSSLDVLPPGGISVTDPASTGTLSVQLQAGNAGAQLLASSAGGATVTGNGATLSLTGTALEVNAALASLELIEPTTFTQDLLTLSAGDPAELPAQTDILVDIVPQTGPAFVTPPLIVTLQPNALDALPGLRLSDPIASGLAAMGLGGEETLQLTLAVTSGVLLLPGFTDASALAASGLGTGTIELNFTADQIGALNTLLSGLEFVGPSITGGEHLSYALRNLSGVLPAALTYGNIFLNIAGTPGSNGTLGAGTQTVLLGGETLTGTQTITGTTAVLGNISGAGAVAVLPDANLELPANNLFLGGTSLDFGTIAGVGLIESGTLLAADGAAFAGPVNLGTSALLDFSGQLLTGGTEPNDYDLALSLASGAQVIGAGTLVAGYFSESGLIEGPGTILAPSGQTLLIAAGSIGGGADLAVAGGAVMLLGPVTPLYGVFDATPLTIDTSVTLSFLADTGQAPILGAYASTLGGAGGAFVINGPQAFSGTITGFQPGDQLIFPGLTDFSVFNVGNGSFEVGGLDGSGNTDTYEIHASLASSLTPAAGLDAEGDPDVVLRPATVSITPPSMIFEATSGVAQPLQGLSLELTAGTTQSLSLTISAQHGLLSDGTLGPAAKITLTASGIAAMNAALAGLTYTGTGVTDTLTLSSATAPLSGLDDNNIAIVPVAPGATVSGYGGTPISEAQTALFAPIAGVAELSAPLAAGRLVVDGLAVFADTLQANGISGTALLIDAGATAIFDAASSVALGADVTLGDASGAGTLAIVTGNFATRGNVTLAGAQNAAGSLADVQGGLTLSGTLQVGAAAAALDLDGTLSAGAATLWSAGTLFAYGSATAGFGGLTDSGTLILDNTAEATAASLSVTGAGALTLGGAASLAVTGGLSVATAQTLQIGADARLSAGTVAESAGAITVSGQLAASGGISAGGLLTLAGGTLIAPSLIVGGMLEGSGEVNAMSLQNSGVILAQGGALVLGGSLYSGSAIEIAASAALDLAGGMSAPVVFEGAAALLTVNDPANFAAGVENFAGTDGIDLVGVAPGLVSYSGGGSGNVSVENGQGSLMTTFNLEIAAGQPGVSIVSDGAGGALVTLGDELPCFARGTRLLTPHGYREVETLKPGDPLITASGTRRPVRWIGRRTLDLGPDTARRALPVRILPGAFGPGLPARPLRLSPLHCVYADGVLVPVTHLVNNATLLREAATKAMTYYHVELDRHDILLAEGLPCESYFDSGNRGALYHELGRRSPAHRPFAPTVTRGPRLAALRRRLHGIALNTGFSLTYWPSLRAIAAGHTVTPDIRQAGQGRLARFTFPAPVREITLLSAVSAPADTNPDSEDRRELGVCLGTCPGLHPGQGFYPQSGRDEGRWMGRVATLHLDLPSPELLLPLKAVVQSWMTPAVDGRPAGG